ncbi:hypothetical protein DSECCO2_314880 [anaerobic digester metagenome]
MNGLSSGALQRTTSFAQPRELFSFVASAVSRTISPISFTASMLIPVFVEPMFTELQTLSVAARAAGIERMSASSFGVMPFETIAEYPPMKLTPMSRAALSSVFATSTKSSGDLQARPPTSAMGVTDILLLTIGIPYSSSISLPVETRSFASRVILS